MRRERWVRTEEGTRYRVALKAFDEGFAVWVPELRGCNSQGATEAEAMENIRDAIREVLAVRRELGWD